MNNAIVDVLLATYNGEKYLKDFLFSLMRQKDVSVNLFVGDDGSTDSTLEIIEQFEGNFLSLTVFEFDRVGPAINFMSLLKYSTSNFIAFADQDDIWEQVRLKNAVDILRGRSRPTLVVSPLVDFSSGELIKCSLLPVPRSYMKNEIHGCTQLFNRELKEIAILANEQSIVMHDWLINLVADSFGEVFFTSEGATRFRIHQDNYIGLPTLKSRVVFYMNLLTRRERMTKVFSQASVLAALSSDSRTNKGEITLNNWISSVSGPLHKRVRYAARSFIESQIAFFDAIKICLGLFR
jgi:glycosyltransferase involved in cell wall biosynthesis